MGNGQIGAGRQITALGGALMILSLFMPWTEVGGVDFTGWETWTVSDIFFLIAGVVALAAAATGGRIGLFRPDMSLNAAADLLGVVSTVLLFWLVVIEFQEDAGRRYGVYVALLAAIVTAVGAADWRPLRGAPWFPRIDRT